MSLILIAKLVVSLVVGMLGVIPGILPSIFLYRNLANGTDSSGSAKLRYAMVLWSGMAAGWAVASFIVWKLLSLI